MTVQSVATVPLSASGITMVYNDRTVLDVPEFNINSGEVMTIIGPNGSGKTTLLLILALLSTPTTGTINYSGVSVNTRQKVLELRRRVATVFQEPLLLAVPVRENVMLGLRLRKIDKTEAIKRTQKWLERFGVADLENRSPRTLSGGEAKRVSLARAFALQPDVLFLDEPFTALDSPTRQALLEDFEKVVRETKVTTVIVTHDRNEALILADRVAVLIDGKLRQIGTPDEVFSYPADEEVAGFVEVGNIIKGEVIQQEQNLAVIGVMGKQIEAVSSLPVGTKVTACLKFEDITLSIPTASGVSTSARNRLRGVITKIFPIAGQVRVTLDGGLVLTSLVTKRSYEEMDLAVEKEVTATFKASSIHLIPHH